MTERKAMKKIITLALALAFVTPAQANEIQGTRVVGQGAVCGSSEGKAIEVNATTKQESSYCYARVIPVPPTQEQLEIKVQEDLNKTITQEKNANASTTVVDQPITVEPELITEPLTKIEVDVSTGIVTVAPLNEIEIAEVVKAQTATKAKQKAQTEAQKLASENKGTRYCINWLAQNQTGSECGFDPIPATTEEVIEEFDFLKELLAFDWSSFLKLWEWKW